MLSAPRQGQPDNSQALQCLGPGTEVPGYFHGVPLGRENGLSLLGRENGLSLLGRENGLSLLGRENGLSLLGRENGLSLLGRENGLSLLSMGVSVTDDEAPPCVFIALLTALAVRFHYFIHA